MSPLRRILGLPDRPTAPSSASASTAGLATASAVAYPSPLTRAALDPAIAAAFGLNSETETVTRREAMTVPAVRRGRAIIAGTIGVLEWQALRGDQNVTDERPLIAHPDRDTTPQFMYSWTVDDLLFNGVAWWYVREFGGDGYPVEAERIARERVNLVFEGDRWGWRAYVDGRSVEDRRLIRFDGPDEGVLAVGAQCLRTTLMLDQAVRRFARLDVPLGFLRPAEGAGHISTVKGSAGLDDDRSEVDVLLDEWEDARATRTTAFLNRALEYETVMFDAQRVQLSESRQHQAAEVARLMNLPPRYVNAPQASGMTYATTEGDRRDLFDTTLSQYTTAIAQRLSMGDVTPRGQRVAPDVLSWIQGDTKAVLEAAAIGVGIGVLDPAEVRTRWLKLPARETPVARPTLAPTPIPNRTEQSA